MSRERLSCSRETPSLPPALREVNEASALPQRSSRPDASSFFDLALSVLEQWRLVLVVASIALGLGVAYLLCAAQEFTATTTLRIESYSPIISSAQLEQTLRQQTMERDYRETEVGSLKALPVADEALSGEGVADAVTNYLAGQWSLYWTVRGWIGELLFGPKRATEDPERRYTHPVWLLKGYLELISVAPVRDTSLVKVSATTNDPALSRRLADAHGEAFIRTLRSERRRMAIENSKFLEEQADELKRKVAETERRLNEYAAEHHLVSVGGEESLLVRHIGELTGLKAAAMAERIKAESTLQEIRNAGPTESTALDDESVRKLRGVLLEAEAEYATLREKYTDEYPRTLQARAKVQALRNTIALERRQALNGLAALHQGRLAAEEKLAEQIEAQKSAANDTSKRLVEHNVLQREYDSLRDLHQAVLRQLKESQIAINSPRSNVIIREYALLPELPSAPRKGAVLFFSLAVGVLMGAALAVLRDFVDVTVREPGDMAEALGLPTLGCVPRFDEKAVTTAVKLGADTSGPENATVTEESTVIEEAPLVTLRAPQSAAAEAFRTVRTSVLLSSVDGAPRVLLVTSAGTGEGKTTVAANLAITLAKASRRTILVDADLRRPSLAGRLGVEDRGGLVRFLSGETALDEAYVKTATPDLSMLSGGSSSLAPVELLGSSRMVEMIEELSRTFDHVVIDAPPVLPVADALMLSQLVDGVLLVVRCNQTSVTAADEAVRRLKGVRAPILGAVVNDVNPTVYAAQYCGGEGAYYSVDHFESDSRRAVG